MEGFLMLPFLTLGINIIVEVVMIVIILIGTFIGILLSLKGSPIANSKALDILAIIIMVMYITDLILPLVLGRIYASRIPFTIGTILGPIIIVTRFVTPFDKYKSTIAMLSIISMFVYLCYPNPSLEDAIFSFRNVQVFNYFGICFAYGVLSLTSKEVSFNIKNWYKTLLGLTVIEVWALMLKLLFITIPEDVENVKLLSPVIANRYNILIPSIIIILISFLMCFGVYLIYELIIYINRKLNKKELV